MTNLHFDFELTAKNIDKKQPCCDLRELDYNFWVLVKLQCEANNQSFIKQLGLSEKSVRALMNANLDDLYSLASGAILSFGFKNNEHDFIRIIQSEDESANNYFERLNNCSKGIEHCYWNLVRLLSTKGNREFVSVAFGISYELINVLNSASLNQVLSLAEKCELYITLRCDDSSITEILEKPNAVSPRILKYLQSISKIIEINHNLPNYSYVTNFFGEYHEEPEKKEEITYFTKYFLARFLLTLGTATQIVQLETGFNSKKIYSIEKDLKSESTDLPFRKVKAVSESSSIITTTDKSMQACLLMSLYNFTASDSLSITKNIQLNPLLKAFELYHLLLNEIQPRWQRLNFTEAWSLARELRSEKAFFQFSKLHHCIYFVSIDQKIFNDCPFDSEIRGDKNLISEDRITRQMIRPYNSERNAIIELSQTQKTNDSSTKHVFALKKNVLSNPLLCISSQQNLLNKDFYQSAIKMIKITYTNMNN